MFDSLKNKLNSFRNDVEETAEENVEELDEDELDAAGDDDAVESETAADADPSGSDTSPGDADDTVESAPSPDADPDAAESADVEPPDADAATPDADAATPDAEAPADAATSDGSEPTQATAGERVRQAQAAESESEPDTDEPAPDDPDAVGTAEARNAVDAGVSEAVSGDTGTGIGRKLKSAVKGRLVIEEDDLEGPLWELEMALLESDVEMSVAEEILERIEEQLVGETRLVTNSVGSVIEDAVRNALYEVVSVGQFDFDERVARADKPLVIVFTGVNGVGKTTTIAKLSNYLEDRGYSTVLANGDTYRAGANEQIREHAEALGKKLIAHEQGGDPAAVVYDGVEYAEANDIDVVLGDTAGRLHTNQGLMDQLEKIDRVVDPDMTLFVDEAVAGQDAVQRARTFNEAAAIDGAILTKADADSQGGAAISIAHVTGKPILFLGVGQGYDDIEPFDPEAMVDRLLGEE